MKKLFFLLQLLFSCFATFSQGKSNSTLAKVREEYSIGHQSGNPILVQKAVQDCQSLIKQFQKNNELKNLATAYTLFGQILVENGKFAESKEILSKALELSSKEFGNDADETLEAKKYLSWAFGYLGDANIELKYSEELLEAYKRNFTKYELAIADLYNTIGMNYGNRNNREMEREYFFNSQRMLQNYKPKNEEEKLEVQSLLMNVLNSLSLSFIGSFDYTNALVIARRSLQISEKIAPNNPERTATMVVVGRCIYALEKKCDSAIYYLNTALTLLEANNLKGSPMWLSYRSYKVNILARCGNTDDAKTVARNTVKTIMSIGTSPEEALSQLLILSQNTNAELTTMENQFKEKESVANQKQTKERYMFGGIFLILLLISGTSFGIYRNRQNKKEIEFQKKEIQMQNDLLKQRDVIRKRISKDMHDEIGAGLTHISMICLQGERDLVKQNPIEKPFLDKITSHSIMLSHNLKELIWATKPENDNFLSLCTEIRTYSNNFLENSNIILNLKITDDIDSFHTNPETNRNIYLIVKEGLNNIAKYSNATKVDIDFAVDTEQNFKLVIADNGKGFDLTGQTKGNGLENMKSRATSIKSGAFELKSEIGKGTIVTASGNLS